MENLSHKSTQVHHHQHRALMQVRPSSSKSQVLGMYFLSANTTPVREVEEMCNYSCASIM